MTKTTKASTMQMMIMMIGNGNVHKVDEMNDFKFSPIQAMRKSF